MMDGKPLPDAATTPRARHHRTPNLEGRRFGRLVVTTYAGANGKKASWTVRCDCGTEKNLVGAELRKGGVQSCGCLAREKASARLRTHGMSGHPAFWVWRSMIDRCALPSHHAWERYGGRGIRVCARWLRFSDFWSDMGPTYKPGLTLDRLDNEKGYSPENCEWRDRVAQARNTRANRVIDTPKGRMLMVEAAELSGIGATTLAYRIAAGWPTRALFDPPGLRNRWSSTF